MPRFAYRAIRVKMVSNSKTRRGYWSGTKAVLKVQDALLFGRLNKQPDDIIHSLGEKGLNPEIVDVFLSSKASNVLPAERAVVPTFTLKGSVAPLNTAVIVT